jgi:hypothetical protein
MYARRKCSHGFTSSRANNSSAVLSVFADLLVLAKYMGRSDDR